MEGTVHSINVKGSSTDGVGLPKTPVEMAFIYYAGVEGDYNNYRIRKNKGWKRAVSLHCLESLEEINREGFSIKPGDLGENITTRNILYDSIKVGGIYQIGDSVIEITEPIVPCENLHLLPYFRGINVSKVLKGRRGWYASVYREGVTMSGDYIKLISK